MMVYACKLKILSTTTAAARNISVLVKLTFACWMKILSTPPLLILSSTPLIYLPRHFHHLCLFSTASQPWAVKRPTLFSSSSCWVTLFMYLHFVLLRCWGQVSNIQLTSMPSLSLFMFLCCVLFMGCWAAPAPHALQSVTSTLQHSPHTINILTSSMLLMHQISFYSWFPFKLWFASPGLPPLLASITL